MVTIARGRKILITLVILLSLTGCGWWPVIRVPQLEWEEKPGVTLYKYDDKGNVVGSTVFKDDVTEYYDKEGILLGTDSF